MSTTTKIPFIVYQTFATNNLPQTITDTIEHNKKLCPKFQFVFYDNNDVDAFIKENFDERVYRAYKMLNPKLGALLADFFRYCVLYKNGGVYLDIKIKLHRNLEEVILPDTECILDRLRYDQDYWRRDTGGTYEQWMLFFAPEHVYLKKIIDMMVERILSKWHPPIYYGNQTKNNIMLLTGPDALSEAIRSCGSCNHITINYEKEIAKYTGNSEMYTMNGMKHYTLLNEESIYIS